MENKYNIINFYIQKRDYAKAEKLIRDELVKDPDDEILHRQLAMVYLDTKRDKESKREIDLLLSMNPEDGFHYYLAYRYFLLMQNVYKARLAIREAIKIDPEDADYFGAIALLDFELHMYESALEYAVKGLSLSPNHVTCMNVRTNALKRLGKKKEVKESLLETLKEHPDSSWSHENAGWIFLNEGEFRKAEEHFLTSLQKDPNDKDAKRGYVAALRGKTGWFGFLFRSKQGGNNFYSQWFLFMVVIFFMACGVLKSSYNYSRDYNLVYLISIVSFVLVLPYYIQTLLDFTILRKGNAKLIFEQKTIMQLYIGIVLFPLALVFFGLTFLTKDLSPFNAVFILSLIGISEGFLTVISRVNKFIRFSFYGGFFICGVLCQFFYFHSIYPEPAMAYVFAALALPAVNLYFSRLFQNR